MNKPIASYKRNISFPKYENLTENSVGHKNLSAAHVGSVICQGDSILVRTFSMKRKKVTPLFTNVIKESSPIPINFKRREPNNERFINFVTFLFNFEKLANKQRHNLSNQVKIKNSSIKQVKFNLW